MIGGLLPDGIKAGWLAGAPLIGELASWRQVSILVARASFALPRFLLVIHEPEPHSWSALLPIADVVRCLTANGGGWLASVW